MDWAEKARSAKSINVQSKTLRSGLQEVAVARGTLRVELEVFYTAVLQDDELDVLAADIDDHVRVVVKFQRGFGVRHGFDQARHRPSEHLSEYPWRNQWLRRPALRACAFCASTWPRRFSNISIVS